MTTPQEILEWLAAFPGGSDQPKDAPFPNSAVAWRLAERVFVGDAAEHFAGDSLAVDGGDSWMSDKVNYASFAGVNAHMLVVPPQGKYAICGAVRNSDNPTAGKEAIGIAGVVVNDKPMGNAWGLYSDLQHEPGANVTFGLEIAAKNKGADATISPYAPAGGVFGIWLAGGGDDAYGGAPANPSNAAIVVLKNAHTWNRGIVVKADALTGCDGVTGAGIAMHMARGHTIRWDAPDGGLGASIRSDVNNSSAAVSLVFSDNGFVVIGANGQAMFTCLHVPNAVNRVYQQNAVAGQAPAVCVSGADTNIDLRLVPKGTGRVQFGTHQASADAPVTGYIEIKDASGAVRKLAVIA